MGKERSELGYAAGFGLAVALAVTLAGPKSLAQPEVEPLVVIGHAQKPAGPSVSYPIGYRDLDLRAPAGQEELRRRVAVTAKYVCHKLGSMDRQTLKECIENARKDGMIGARKLFDEAAMSKASFRPGPGWKPPPGYR